MKYFKPKSVTWISGALLVLQGLLPLLEGNSPDFVKLSEGAGLIGLRGSIGN